MLRAGARAIVLWDLAGPDEALARYLEAA